MRRINNSVFALVLFYFVAVLEGCSGGPGGSNSVPSRGNAPEAAANKRSGAASVVGPTSVGTSALAVSQIGGATLIKPAVTKRGVPYVQLTGQGLLGIAGTPFSDKTFDECYNSATAACAVQGVASHGWRITVICNSDPDCPSSTYSFSLAPGSPAGVTATWSPAVISPGTYSASTVSSTATTPLGTISMTYDTTLVSGNGSIPSPISAPTQFLCGSALKTCPQVAIEDINLNKVVSASPPPTTNTVVGEQEALTVKHVTGTGKGTGYTITGTPAWTVGGTAYTEYTLGKAATPPSTAPTPVPVAHSDLTKVTPTPFYWFEKGTNDISVTAQLTGTVANGSEISDFTPRAKYNVLAPSGVAIRGTPGKIFVQATSTVVTIGTGTHGGAPGINFVFTATAPGGGAGHLAASQSFTDYCITRLVSAATQYSSLNTTKNTLDNFEFYPLPPPGGGSTVPIGAGASASWISNDNPSVSSPLVAGLSKLSVNSDVFKNSFLYQPTGVGGGVGKSVWVPLGTLNWQWHGSATRTRGVWSATGSVTASGAPGLSFPAWSSLFTNSIPTWGTTPNC